MSHAQSLFYLRLLSNALMAISLGIIFPYTVITTARTLRYMQGPTARTWLRLLLWWLASIALSYVFGVINEYLGPWSSEVMHVYLQMTAALFTVTLSVYCYLNRYLLKSLYPKEDFVVEQEKRQHLLDKMLVCDGVMPLSRFESKHGVVTMANKAAIELTGYSLLELHRLAPGQLVHPDDRERVMAHLLSCSLLPFECRIVTKDGRAVHMEVHCAFDPHDPALRISFLTDVTRYVQERDRRINELRSMRALQQREAETQALQQTITAFLVER